jgi:hypothetical protein
VEPASAIPKAGCRISTRRSSTVALNGELSGHVSVTVTGAVLASVIDPR